jgi:hypothetical protein
VFHVVLVSDESRAELGIGIDLKGDQVGNLFHLAAHVADIDGKRIVGNVAYYQIVAHRCSLIYGLEIRVYGQSYTSAMTA